MIAAIESLPRKGAVFKGIRYKVLLLSAKLIKVKGFGYKFATCLLTKHPKLLMVCR